jgi:hypothetical protein
MPLWLYPLALSFAALPAPETDPWLTSYAEAQAAARLADKPILAVFR